MSIRPVDMSGVTMRSQDVSALKANEDAKPFAQQLVIESDNQKKERALADRVNDKDRADEQSKKFDAKEKGSNEYFNNRKNTKKKEEKRDKAVPKKPMGGFDMRI